MTSITVTVLAGTSLLGAVAGMLGSFAVLRRRALVGDVLAHAALPGLCLAFLIFSALSKPQELGRSDGAAAGAASPSETSPVAAQETAEPQGQFLAMLLGAFTAGVAALALMTFLCRWTRTKEDAAIGIVLSTFFGAGIVLWSIVQRRSDGRQSGLETYIYGQAAGIVRQDVWLIAAVSLVALILLLALYKEFKLFSFDPDFAQAQGWPTLRLDLLMMGSLAMVTVAGLPAVGVVLMAAMLIVPGAAARFWVNRLGPMLAVSGVFGCLAAAAGTLLSTGMLRNALGFDPLAFGYNSQNLPTGPLIVLSGTAIFLVSLLFAPRRGIVARGWAHLHLRWTTAQVHLLRTLYELSESALPACPAIPREQLAAARAWQPGELRLLTAFARARGDLRRTGAGLQLTAEGLERAVAATRAHRLWELYMIQGAGIAADHVDRDADSIEHYLGPEMVRQLESALAGEGRLPAQAVPRSPHETAAASATPDHSAH